MATTVMKNAYFSFGGQDLTAYCRQITLNWEADAPEDTVFGSTVSHRSRAAGGLKDWSMDVQLIWDAAAVEAYVYAGLGASSAIIAKPNGSATAAGNPKYTGNGIVLNYAPIDASVGDVAIVNVRIAGTGTLSRATSD